MSVVVIKNGLAAFSGEDAFLRRDIRIDNGVIAEIGTGFSAGYNVIDATDCWVLPGGIDPHVHFYDPGYTEKEDFYHGTRAAAAGGITTVVDMPCTSVPPVTDAASLRAKLSVIDAKASVDYGLFAGMSRQLFDSHKPDGYEAAMASVATDVLGYKVYAVSGVDKVWGAVDHWRFRRIVETVKRLGSIVLLHAEDAEYVRNAGNHFKHQGNNPRQWYDSRPELAEILAVESAMRIVEEADGDLHIVHIGSADAAALLENSKNTAATITGETCPHYLAFGLEEFEKQGAVLKISPSIKRGENREPLWQLLRDGILSFVASDHAPGTDAEKAPGDIWENSAGIAGVETMLPYLFYEGHLQGRLSLPRYLAVMHENAAKRYRLYDRKGSIAVGKHADFVIIDSRSDWTVKAIDFQSKGKLSPFEGRIFRGTVTKTIVRGKVVYDRDIGIIDEAGWGERQKPEKDGRGQ